MSQVPGMGLYSNPMFMNGRPIALPELVILEEAYLCVGKKKGATPRITSAAPSWSQTTDLKESYL